MSKLEIKSLKKAKRKGFYEVETTNGKYVLSENIIVSNGIINNALFEEGYFEEILKKNEDEKIIFSVYNYITFKMRSEKEIKDYLEGKGANTALVNKCINDLKNLGYINDYELAKSLMNYIINNHKGPKALQIKLKEKGIDDKIIDDVCSLYTSSKQEEVINIIMDSLINKYQNEPVKKQKQKIQEKLIRDGFSSNIVFSIVSSLNLTFNNQDKLEKDALKIKDTLNSIKYKDCNKYEIKNKFINKLLLKGYEYKDINNYLYLLDDEK